MLVKNINSTHRIDGVNSQFALSGALKSAISKLDLTKWAKQNADLFPTSSAQ